MPNLSLDRPHPVGFVNPVVMRATAALEAAGAWDAAPTEVSCAGAEGLTLSLTYTRGAVGGAYYWQMEFSIYAIANDTPAGAQEWADQSLLAPGAVVVNVDSQSQVQEDHQEYGAVGAAAEAYVFGPMNLEFKPQRMRIRCRESGVVGTPGTLQITGLFW